MNKEGIMKKAANNILMVSVLILISACSTAYKQKPLPFRAPDSYANATEVAGATVGAKAFDNKKEAKEAFGFAIRDAGLLPVQLVLENQGTHPLSINAGQTFLEDEVGNLWPILDKKIAYERTTKYAETNEIFKEAAYSGFLGAAAGAIVGAAVGIVSGENVVEAAGKGAAVGAAGGALFGGVKGMASNDVRREIIDDLKKKSLEEKPVEPGILTFGFLFFPGEVKTAKQLRLQLKETDTGKLHVVKFDF